MAQQISADIYGMNRSEWATSSLKSFPTQGISCYPPDPAIMMGGIYMMSVIKLFSEDGQPEYFSNSDPAELVTQSNM